MYGGDAVMGLFDRFKKKKDPNSKQFRREFALAINGRHIRYVTEKRNGVEEVIGREGHLNIKDDEMLIYASSDVAHLKLHTKKPHINHF